MTEMMDRLIRALAEQDNNQHRASYYRGMAFAALRELKTPSPEMLAAVDNMAAMAEASVRPLARQATTQERWVEMIDAALGEI